MFKRKDKKRRITLETEYSSEIERYKDALNKDRSN